MRCSPPIRARQLALVVVGVVGVVGGAGCFSPDVDAVREAADGTVVEAPEGTVEVDGETQHVTKTPRIGRIREDGLIETVEEAAEPVAPDPFLTGYDWADGVSG